MKKFLLLLSLCIVFQSFVFAEDTQVGQVEINLANVQTYSQKGKFGLTDGENNITKPIYKKLIRLGESSWIVQYKSKYGLMDSNGNYLILPKYRNVERFTEKYVKLGNDNDYGLYDEHGQTIIQPEFSSIDIMYGKMFLTCKNYKYGIVDINGNTILENEFDDIYMPKANVLRIQYNGNWCEIEKISEQEISLPQDINKLSEDKDFKMTNLVVNTGVMSGYSVLTFTDYVLKLVSSISPAYEATIDELMYLQGADAVNVLMKFIWLPKFPVVYAKHYYKNLRNPNTGVLSTPRKSLKKQMR
ncbi:MAG: WG repeat-containing protein [Candidatus Gastranaerophilales bacterium]|nr:WG repeat-containing protein [Candidatus Gastranaerophilales bacterium]